MGITVQDLKSMIRDTVSSQLADRAIDADEQARGAFDAAMKRGDPEFLAKMRALVTGKGSEARADYSIGMDPLKGAGLDFARAVRAITHAKMRGGVAARDVAKKWHKEGFVGYAHVADQLEGFEARALELGTFTGAGVLVPETLSGEFIALLYNRAVSSQMGARDFAFRGSISLGKLNSGATVGYVGEEQNITPSQPGLGAVKLTGKKAAGLVALSNELLALPEAGADAMVRDDLLKAMALRRDLSFYRGTGSEVQPKGVYSWTKSANKFNQTGTALANKVADYLKLAQLVEEANHDTSSAAYVMAIRTFFGLAATLDGQGNFVFLPMLMAGNLFGYRVGKTQQIPTNLGGSNSEVYFGVHSEVLMGRDTSRPLEVEAMPNGAYHNGTQVVAGFSNDTSPIRIIESHDVAARYDNAFSVLEQVTITA